MTTYRLELPFKRPPLSHNDRHHWRVKADKTRQVRRAAKLLAWQAGIGGPHEHITVQLHYAPGDNRRRDAPNLTATSKPAIDGLVDAGVVPDDHDTHVTEHMPVIHKGPGAPSVWLEVEITE